MREGLELVRLLCQPRVAWRVIRALRLPSVRLIFEPRDLWIGVYWTPVVGLLGNLIALDVYVCIVPCLPVLLTWGVDRDRRTLDWSDLPSGEVVTQ